MLLYAYVWNVIKTKAFFVYFILDSFEMCMN